jgi:hypothetical protein
LVAAGLAVDPLAVAAALVLPETAPEGDVAR